MSSMYVFTPKCEVQFAMFYWLYHEHASAGALIHQQQTIYWIFTQTKLSSIYRHKPIFTYWALMKRHALLQFRRNGSKLKHRAILYSEAEVFSLSITNPNGEPMLPFDWLIYSGLILARSSCREIWSCAFRVQAIQPNKQYGVGRRM